MSSVFQSLRKWYEGHILLMDTGPAAILGSLEDERVKDKESFIGVIVGNAHTIAMFLKERKVMDVFEHHTHLINKQKLIYFLKKLSAGDITFEEVYEDGGHGALSLMRDE